MTFAERAVEWLSQIEFLAIESGFHRPADGPPIRIEFETELLDKNAESLMEAGAEYWPSVDRELSAFRLLSVHLQEALATLDPATRVVRFNGTHFEEG